MIASMNYATERGFNAIIAYAEPRFGFPPFFENRDYQISSYFSIGGFAGISGYSDVVEAIFGVDLNVTVKKMLSDSLFIEAAVGIQYPDFPLVRSFRFGFII